MEVFVLSQVVTDNTLPILYRDPLLSGANNGVKLLVDLASTYSWPKQAAPVNTDAVLNLDESGNNASVVIGANGAPTYAGRGFDFGAVTGIGEYIQGDGGFAAALAADTNQYFMIMLYLRMPAQVDWPTTGGLAVLTFSQSSSRYSTVPEIVELTPFGQSSGTRYLIARRQTAVGSADQFNLLADATDYGAFAQIAFWRNAAGCGFRLKTASRTVKTTGVVGANNTASLTGLKARFGVPSITSLTGTNNNFRIYRLALEDLSISGRDPEAVLDADWARVVARAIFS
ncbi:hypothetical protein [Paraburkholderia caribensis]|uniref:hypothetical protein n=1 Tax=Paraburkholderia caribensis TaxID=75105 RepID=UPI00072120B2|nr:hypothetical protein [Paraburkholderia caribensis]ALP62831.1 hypothetical protein AN416_09630 [Paraburkholderia caribensis]AUT51938.1 hypothetical protein C2L66_08770 [Paraburkholderia caribensis]